MGWVVNATPRPLYRGKDTVTILQEAGWATGPVWTGAEYSSHNGIRSPDRPARSKSLYRLRYNSSQYVVYYLSVNLFSITSPFGCFFFTTIGDACDQKVKRKGRGWGPLALQPFRLFVPWPRRSSFIHLCTSNDGNASASEGRNYGWKFCLRSSNSHRSQGSFTCRKTGTRDRFFYFPSEGGEVKGFLTLVKNPTTSAGFEPANSGTRGHHANH
jgi:hypothetical protein